MAKTHAMKLTALVGLLAVAPCAAIECRSAVGMDDNCDLEVVPSQTVLTIPGLTKICGMMYAAHLYTKHYDTLKTEIHSYCDSTSETICCPTATLGIVSTKGESCQKETNKETKSCEPGSNRGKPDTEGSYNAYVAYSVNMAGSKELKGFMGCHDNCAPNIIKGLKAYTAGTGKDDLVATLLAEMEGNVAAKIPSMYPKQSNYQGTLYCGRCDQKSESEDKAQKSICECRLNSTSWTKKPAYCNKAFPELTKDQKKEIVSPAPDGSCTFTVGTGSPSGIAGDNAGSGSNAGGNANTSSTGSTSGSYTVTLKLLSASVSTMAIALFL